MASERSFTTRAHELATLSVNVHNGRRRPGRPLDQRLLHRPTHASNRARPRARTPSLWPAPRPRADWRLSARCRCDVGLSGAAPSVGRSARAPARLSVLSVARASEAGAVGFSQDPATEALLPTLQVAAAPASPTVELLIGPTGRISCALERRALTAPLWLAIRVHVHVHRYM